MARIHYIRYPDLAVICLPVALLGNPLLLAAAVGRGIVAAGTLRIAGILLGLGGIALVVRLRGIGRLVILLLGVIGLLVLAVGFFLLLGLGSRGLRRLFFAWLLFVFILYRCGGPFRRAASLLCNAGTSKLRCRKAHQKRNDNSLCSHIISLPMKPGVGHQPISNARLAFTSARGASFDRGRRRLPRGRYGR